VLSGAVLVVGQRADVDVHNRVLYRPECVQQEVTALKGRLHPAYGIDYFAIARNQFPWSQVPDLIIGHPGYDNFLVAVASTSNVSVVDATETLAALHQTDQDGVGTGHKRDDRTYNHRRIVGSLGQLRGCSHIQCTKYRTRWLQSSTTDSYSTVPQKTRRISIELRQMTSHNTTV